MRHLALALIALAATAAFAQPPSRTSDWPQFRGPSGMGVSADRGVPQTWGPAENIVWKTPLPGGGTSSPIVSGDRIFLTCYSGYGPVTPGGTVDQLQRHVLGLDRATGRVLWTTPVPGNGPEEARIREDHGYASSTPTADAERVYAFFGRAGVFAYDRAGKQLWRADVGSRTNGWGSATSPLLHGDLLIVNASVESESLVALDRRTGREVWRARGMREAWNTPLVVTLPNGGKELVLAVFGKVLGLDPASGRELWSCATDIPWYMVPSLVAHEGIIYCIGGRSGGGSLAVRAGGRGDVTATHRVWSARRGSNVPSPIYHNGYVYWARDSPGVAICADAKTGDVVYEERLGNQVYASPVLADGKLYYLDRGGKCHVLPAAPRFQILATNDLGERGYYNASPAVAGGRLYIRSDRFLYCIGSRS